MAVRLQVLGPRKLVLDVFRPQPKADEALVSARLSAISQGSELLHYRGELSGLDRNGEIDAVQNNDGLGYASVGVIKDPGRTGLEAGQRVFCLGPHASDFCLQRDLILPIPDDIPDERALFYANMETAVTLVWDLHARLGEKIALWGLGVVGGLSASLLTQFPLELRLFEANAERRERMQTLLGRRCEKPLSVQDKCADFDASLDVSGNAAALNAAIFHACYSGRIIVGSWFGNKEASLQLGGAFHRRRLQLISSQVSSLAPDMRGRFDRQRRSEIVWDQLRNLNLETWITHRWTLDDAAEAYGLLSDRAGSALQTIFVYERSRGEL